MRGSLGIEPKYQLNSTILVMKLNGAFGMRLTLVFANFGLERF